MEGYLWPSQFVPCSWELLLLLPRLGWELELS